jgi:hypothetical protein
MLKQGFVRLTGTLKLKDAPINLLRGGRKS